MRADIRFRRSRSRLELSSKDGLKSEMPPPDEFDSHVEEAFAKKWGKETRDGWSMKREATLLHKRQVAFIVDFSFQHEDGRKALLEIVGFWTHEYLKKKIAKLALFEDEHIILAVAEGVAEKWPNMPSNVILYKTALKLNDVLRALDQVAPQ
jgi:hypothetical protein